MKCRSWMYAMNEFVDYSAHKQNEKFFSLLARSLSVQHYDLSFWPQTKRRDWSRHGVTTETPTKKKRREKFICRQGRKCYSEIIQHKMFVDFLSLLLLLSVSLAEVDRTRARHKRTLVDVIQYALLFRCVYACWILGQKTNVWLTHTRAFQPSTKSKLDHVAAPVNRQTTINRKIIQKYEIENTWFCYLNASTHATANKFSNRNSVRCFVGHKNCLGTISSDGKRGTDGNFVVTLFYLSLCWWFGFALCTLVNAVAFVDCWVFRGRFGH